MTYNFDEIVNRRGTNSWKWDGGEKLIETGYAERYDRDTLPLFTADMDIAVPPAIVEAMHRVADQRIYGYSLIPKEYNEAVINWFRRRHRWEIRQEEIVFCPGTVNAVNRAIRAFTDKGDGIIIQRPVYYPFTSVIEQNKRKVANNQMIQDKNGYYRPNLEEFEQIAGRPENKLFILCNPHNPSGRIFSNEDLKEMARICQEKGVIMVADEIHGDLIRRDKTFTPVAKVAASQDHILTCTAINKTFNVAGLHGTNMIIPNEKLRKIFLHEQGGVMASPFTIAAVIAAYTQCDEWLEEIKEYFDGTIEWVMAFLKKEMPPVKFVRPEGTYIFWMDFRAYGLPAAEIRKKIYVDANVILESGVMFDPDRGAGFERICLSSPRPVIQEAFKRIAAQFRSIPVQPTSPPA